MKFNNSMKLNIIVKNKFTLAQNKRAIPVSATVTHGTVGMNC